MNDQNEKINGYRNLNQSEIDCINKIKNLAIKVGELTDEVKAVDGADMRWASIGVTDLQKGFMALVRAVAKPESF